MKGRAQLKCGPAQFDSEKFRQSLTKNWDLPGFDSDSAGRL